MIGNNLEILGPRIPQKPVILSVPHAGRDYPEEMLAQAAVSKAILEQLEDRHADALILKAIGKGATAVVAHHARAWIDLNRDEREIDPAMVEGLPSPRWINSARARGGLGLFPRRMAGSGEFWRRRFDASDLDRRIAEDHQPYHSTIADLLTAAHRRFGVAVLIDCHSMPPLTKGPRPGAAMVVGDARGRSADLRLVETIEEIAVRHQVRSDRNHPYAGGHTLDRHADRLNGVHAIQIELDRSLYLDATLREPADGLSAMQNLMADIVDAVSAEALRPDFSSDSALAAE